MNLMNKPPVGQKQPAAGRDPQYLVRVRELPCCVCDGFGEHQKSPTQAHHPIHGRGSTRKVPDRMAIPLCEGHHLGDFDTSKIALHREPNMWKEAYGIDREYVAATQDRLGV